MDLLWDSWYLNRKGPFCVHISRFQGFRFFSYLDDGLMMTSSNGNIFCVTGPLCGNSPVTGEFPSHSQWREGLSFSLICAWINGWVNRREASYLRRHRVDYDITVISCMPQWNRTQPEAWYTLQSDVNVTSFLKRARFYSSFLCL